MEKLEDDRRAGKGPGMATEFMKKNSKGKNVLHMVSIY